MLWVHKVCVDIHALVVLAFTESVCPTVLPCRFGIAAVEELRHGCGTLRFNFIGEDLASCGATKSELHLLRCVFVKLESNLATRTRNVLISDLCAEYLNVFVLAFVDVFAASVVAFEALV